MFAHIHELQFEAKPDGPDPAFARRLQEVLGGQWGEMTVAMQYLYQGWNCRLPGKYKDMLLAIGTEELAHVEMLATMIDRLLDVSPLTPKEAVAGTGTTAAFSASNPQHQIVNGGGSYPRDSMGVPWSGAYITASGNLMADFQLNATAEMQGRLQVSRLYNMTDDPGVRDLLRFLITRDHYHQMQWLAAIEDLKSDGLENVPVPEAFPLEEEQEEFARVFLDGSNGEAATEGSWANGEGADGHGPLTHAKLDPNAPAPILPPGDPRLYGTPPADGHTLLQKAKDALT